jgi:LMBR1 domain-containing protein 1
VTANVFVGTLEDAKLYQCLNDKECSRNTLSLSFNVQFIVYVVALVNTFGWVVFLLLGGCGMWSLPIELIKTFVYRPKRLKSEEFILLKDQVMRKTEKMIELGNKIQEAKDEGKFKGKKNQQLLKDFRESTLALEDHWEVIQTSFYQGGGKIILPYCYLLLGIICVLLSGIWILQLILWLVIPRGYNFGFLNYVLYYSDFIFEFLPFIGTILYCLFVIYLIVCIIAGAMKIARQIPFLSVHPLKPGDTMMNSLLFNAGLFLVASLTISQFAADAFSQYISSTVLDTMYNGVIKNLFLLNYFYLVINYILLAFGIFGMILSVIFARNKTKDEKQLEAVITKLLADNK